MSRQRMFIPTMQALGLVLTSGCQAPGLGEWVLSSTVTVGSDGFVYATPFPNTYEYGDYVYTIGMTLTINKDGTGAFAQYYSYASPTYNSRDEYSFSLIAEQLSRGRWDIDIPDIEVSLVCTTGKAITSDQDSTWGDSKAKNKSRLVCDVSPDSYSYMSRLNWTRP